MKRYFFLIMSILIISCQREIKSEPKNFLNKSEISDFKSRIVRYFEGLPPTATHQTKWDTLNNDYYNKKAEAADLLHFFRSEDGYTYFAVSKIAPSLKLKKVATIGKLKIAKDTIVYYEEICRTWKMPLQELKDKTKILFDKIVNKEDVSGYYTKNLPQDEFWIEFPDDYTYYDIKNRVWQTKN